MSSQSPLGFVCSLLFLAFVQLAHGQYEPTWIYSVQLSADIESSPPAITLSWPQDDIALPEYYKVSRKLAAASEWGPAQLLPGTTTNVIDTNVRRGLTYEYQVYKYTTNHTGYGYISAGIELPLLENRGKIILLSEKSVAEPLSAELARLEQDLVGDGWQVLRHDIPREISVPQVKAIVQSDYASDPANVKALFLFGRIPVPYSGNAAPDGHFVDHTGAWPADTYYANMHGDWTDTIVWNTTASDPRNFNVPGDGKYDQSEIPGSVDLEVGRVDLANMPGIDESGASTFPSEVELLRQYLNKDHRHRHKLFSLSARGLVFNVIGDRAGEAFATDAWRNYSALYGPPPASPLHGDQFIPVLRTNGYQMAYATCGSSYSAMFALGGVIAGPDWGNAHWGGTVDFYRSDIQTSFVMLLGSWLGDWDTQDNLMRAVLATPSYGLSCVYAGRPHWYFHPMGIGATLGFCARLTQNNHADGLYQNQSNNFAGYVHAVLLGDPTLRLHPVAPPKNLQATRTKQGVQLTWSWSPEAVLGHHVYRAPDRNGPFQRLTPSLLSVTNYLDGSDVPDGDTYMVRAVKLQTSPSGSYFNPSQGIFVTLPMPPPQVAVDSNGVVSLSFRSTGRKAYRIFWSDSLNPPAWVSLPRDLLATGSNATCWISTSDSFGGTGWTATNSASAGSAATWIDDALPLGGNAGPDSDPWSWVSATPPPYSGTASVQAALKDGMHQQFCYFPASDTLGANAVLVAAVYPDANNTPSEVMLQWYDGSSWDHRAYWGANLITYGASGSTSRFYAGELPPQSKWTLLRVSALDVGLAGAKVSGVALTLHGGAANWDLVGREDFIRRLPTTASTSRFFKIVVLP